MDVTVADLFQSIGSDSFDHVAVLKKRRDEKLIRYADECERANFDFVPFIMHTNGGFGEDAEKFIQKLAVPWSKRRGLISVSMGIFQIKQRFQMALKMDQSLSLRSRGDVYDTEIDLWDSERGVEIADMCIEPVVHRKSKSMGGTLVDGVVTSGCVVEVVV